MMLEKAPENWIEKNDLISHAAQEGVRITSRQLKEWHLVGLLPKPRQIGKRGTGGSQTLYPASTLSQLEGLLRVRRRSLHFAQNGWDLWFYGFEVPQKYWLDPLRTNAKALDRLLRRISEPREPGIDASLELKASVEPQALRAARLPASTPVVGIFKRQLKSSKAASLILRVLDVPLGNFEEITGGASNPEPDSTQSLFEQLMGFTATNSLKDSAFSTLSGAAMVHQLGIFSGHLEGLHFAKVLQKTPIDRLLQARSEFSLILLGISHYANQIQLQLGKTIPITSWFHHLSEGAGIQEKARHFLFWLAIRDIPNIRVGIDNFMHQYLKSMKLDANSQISL